VTINLTRFYFDTDQNFLNEPAFEDIETINAEVYEQHLQDKEIVYIRIDL